MKKHKYIIKQFYFKLKKMDFVSLFLLLFKVKNDINIILKIIFFILVSKPHELMSIWDLGDLALKMVEQESIKNDIIDSIAVVDPTSDTATKEGESDAVDINSMELGEWLDYLREHEPKAYWFWVLAFAATSVFCVWLMHYLIGPGFPPKEPY